MINVMDNIKPTNVASLACDDSTDVQDLPDYARQNKLKLGSTCLCIATGTVYAMKSDYSWVEL